MPAARKSVSFALERNQCIYLSPRLPRRGAGEPLKTLPQRFEGSGWPVPPRDDGAPEARSAAAASGTAEPPAVGIHHHRRNGHVQRRPHPQPQPQPRKLPLPAARPPPSSRPPAPLWALPAWWLLWLLGKEAGLRRRTWRRCAVWLLAVLFGAAVLLVVFMAMLDNGEMDPAVLHRPY
jgi:hypothetical protein